MIKRYLQHFSGLPKPSWFILFLHFMNATFISICYFLPLYFVNQLGFDVSTAGYMIAFYSLGTIAGGAIGGGYADTISPRKVVIASLAAQAVAFLCLALHHSAIAFMFNLFVLGLTTYSFITANFLWALSFCRDNEQQKIKMITMLDTVSNLGLGISALIISALMINTFQLFSIIAGMILLIISGYLLLYYHHTEIPIANQNTPTENSVVTYHANVLVSYAIISLFLTGLIITQLSTTYSIYLHTLFPSVPFGGFGFLFALNTFMVVTMQTPIANTCRSYNRVFMIGIGTFLLGFGMFMLSFVLTYVMVILACMIYTVGEMLFFSVAQLVCYENAPANKKGFVLGMYRTVYASSRVLGPAAGGYIYQHFGSTSLWYLCGIIGLFCLFSTLHFYRYANVPLSLE